MTIASDRSTPPLCSRQSSVRCAGRNFAPMQILSDSFREQGLWWLCIARLSVEVTL